MNIIRCVIHAKLTTVYYVKDNVKFEVSVLLKSIYFEKPESLANKVLFVSYYLQ